MNNQVLLLMTFLTIIASVNSLKLLLVFPVTARSHYILGRELGKGLAKLGHDVTLLSAFEEKEPPKDYKNINIDAGNKKYDELRKKINLFNMENMSPYSYLLFLTNIGPTMAEMTFNHPEIQALLKSNQQFDAVIVEQFWNDAMKIFAYHFSAPLILFNSLGANRWVNNLVANPENPSYIPDISLSFSEEMNFFERLYNFLYGVVSDVILFNYFYLKQNDVMRKYFPDAPHLNEGQYNVSLVLSNSHESINAAVPHVPNMIDIGGYHVNPPKELSKDLKDFMDSAKEGVIYFSLGSNVIPSFMPKEKKDIILNVLGSRKEKVLWKWDEDELENKPNNIIISKWFPQQDILAHPNCKLFISHGGLTSLTETVYLGVPVLAFPIFGDQKLNAARVKSKGLGLTLPFSEIKEESLIEGLNEVLKNPTYRENAQLSSRLMHDRPIKPIKLADYWIKYVVRHKGAPHLSVAAVNIPLFKYYMLDVLAVILGGFLLVFFVLRKLCGLCFRRKCSNPDKKKSLKNKKE